MRQISKSLLSKSLPVLIVLAVVSSTSALAADIIIYREVPEHNVLDTTVPPGPTQSVPASREDIVLGLVPGARLNDDAVAAVVAPSQAGPGGPSLHSGTIQEASDAARGDALSNLPGSGMGSFSSLGGLGGRISDEVGSAIGNGLNALSNTMNTLSSGGQ